MWFLNFKPIRGHDHFSTRKLNKFLIWFNFSQAFHPVMTLYWSGELLSTASKAGKSQLFVCFLYLSLGKRPQQSVEQIVSTYPGHRKRQLQQRFAASFAIRGTHCHRHDDWQKQLPDFVRIAHTREVCFDARKIELDFSLQCCWIRLLSCWVV